MMPAIWKFGPLMTMTMMVTSVQSSLAYELSASSGFLVGFLGFLGSDKIQGFVVSCYNTLEQSAVGYHLPPFQANQVSQT